jgi:hypothetical protein
MLTVLNPIARWVRAVAVVASLVFASVPASAHFVIDSFDDQQTFWAIGINNADPFVNVALLGSLDRTLIVDVIGTPLPLSSVGTIGGGSLFVNTSVPPSVITLDYESSVGPIDLTEGGINDRLVFDFSFLDAGFASHLGYSILATGSSGVASLSSVIGESAVPFSVEIPLASFTGNVSEFSTLTSLTIVFNTANIANVDFELDEIRAVPEASSIAMVGIGSLAALVIARRRRS